jgi:hypothetical protein
VRYRTLPANEATMAFASIRGRCIGKTEEGIDWPYCRFSVAFCLTRLIATSKLYDKGHFHGDAHEGLRVFAQTTLEKKNIMRTLLFGLGLLISTLSANCGYGTIIFTQNFQGVNFGSSLPVSGSSERANGLYYGLGASPAGLTITGTAFGFDYGSGNDPNKAILLNEPTGALQQVIGGLTVGQLYSVEFEWWVDNNLSSLAGLNYEVTGFTSFSKTRSASSFNTGNFATEYFTFTANGTSHTLVMSQNSPSGSIASPIIDNIKVTAVPLPATLGLLLAGMPGLGLILRRTRRA